MRKKLLASITGAALVLGLTAGCQATPPDIATEQAGAFQSQVLAITTAVADGSYAAALDALTALKTELDAAAADGAISFARHQRIQAALAVVRTDVQTAIDALQPEPAPAPVESADPVDDEVAPPATETDAEKKAREAEEKAAEDAAKKAAEEKKKADEEAADEAKKAADKAKKQTEKDAKDKAKDDAKPDGGPGNGQGTGPRDDPDDD